MFRARSLRRFVALSAVSAVAAATALTVVVAPAQADTAPTEPGTPATVSADALPTTQMDGVAWSQAVLGNRVYVGGDFKNARPAGAAPGTELTPRSNMLAYDIESGNLIADFAPSFNGKVMVVAPSPDGSRIYVGGLFTAVNGVSRYRIAAIDPTTGAVITSFNAGTDYIVKAMAVTNDTVYVGGQFTSANGNARTNLAAFRASDGAVLNWAPTADAGQVTAMVLTPDKSKLVVGGQFTSLNGSDASGLGALDATTGAALPWAASAKVRNGGASAGITSLVSDGTSIYGSGYTYGPGTLEGFFKADPADGSIQLLDDCHGDTYSIFPNAGSVYAVGHSHFCGNLRGFPQTTPWQFNRAIAFTSEPTGVIQKNSTGGYTNWAGQPAPSLQQFFPTLDPGTITGQTQAAWSVTGNDKYVVMGGEFPKVNGQEQQGLVRFGKVDKAPNKVGPEIKGFFGAPKVQTLESGSARVSWPANWDRDNALLHYRVLRDGNTASPVFESDVKSTFWYRPMLGFTETGLEPGRQYRYTVETTDALGNRVTSDPTYFIAGSTGSVSTYAKSVLQDNPANYWRLGEASGTVVNDAAGWQNATTAAGVTRGFAGAIVGDPDTTSRFSGTSTGVAYTSNVQQAPDTFSAEAWVKTNSATGGKIIGFGSSKTGTSGTRDRNIYMRNDGKFAFGVNTNGYKVVNSVAAYNDNQWHHVVATFGDAGTRLIVDGKLVGQDKSSSNAVSYAGYWRVGGDGLSGWPNKPTSDYFKGDIDEAAIYTTELSVAQANTHYVASGRSSLTSDRPADAYGRAVYDNDPLFLWRLNELSGTSAADSSRDGVEGTYAGNPALNQAGTIPGGTAITTDGIDDTVGSKINFGNPRTYSTEAWFKTTTTRGGKIIGFGNAATGLSAQYDRQVQMLNDGRVRFAAGAPGAAPIETTGALNDGQWHHVVASQGSTGMKLYVDNNLIGSNALKTPQDFTGYWRVGGDNVGGESTSNYFAGSVDDVAVYDTVLSAASVKDHYLKGGGVLPNELPSADFAASANNLAASFDGSPSADTDGTLSSYDWDFGDGQTGTGVTTNHTYEASGTYTVTLTVTDNRGGTAVKAKSQAVVANQPPTSSFTSVVTDLGLAVDAAASADSDGTIASYAWDFGDGQTGTGRTATHNYSAAGTYSVKLIVTDDDGATTTLSRDVTTTTPLFYASDDFTRLATLGLGTATTGGPWTVTGTTSNYGVANGVGTLKVATAGGTSTAYLNSVQKTDTEVNAKVSLDKVQTGGGSYVSVIGRRVNSNTDYRTKLRFLSTGEITLTLNKTVAGTETTLSGGKVAGLTYVPSDRLNVRLQVSGTNSTTLKVKVWKVGTVEPTTWNYQSADSAPELQVNGSAGTSLYVSGSSTNAPMTLTVDDLTVGASKND